MSYQSLQTSIDKCEPCGARSRAQITLDEFTAKYPDGVDFDAPGRREFDEALAQMIVTVARLSFHVPSSFDASSAAI